MSNSMVWRLITKDLYLYRWLIVGALAIGIASLFALGIGASVAGNAGESFGLILLLTSIVALGVFIAIYGILTERKEKTLQFVLSLPISTKQYTTAKVLASLIAFLIPWGVLTVTVVGLTLAGPEEGRLPFSVAMMFFFLANFCVLLAIVLNAASEFWAVAGIIVTNVSVSLFMTTVTRLPGVREYQEGDVAVWSSSILAVLAIEAAVIVLSIVLAFFVRSRKKDFI